MVADDVVVHVDPNPKRPGTGAHRRYTAYELGRAQEDLIAAGLTKRDIDWDTKQGHVRFGPGERSSAPIRPIADQPSAPAVRTRQARSPVPAVAASAPEAEASSSGRYPPAPAGRIRAPVTAGRSDRAAPYWIMPTLLEASVDEGAPPDTGNGGRTWTLKAVLPDGRVLVRTERSDRLALERYQAYARHGIDPDDWQVEKKAA